MNIPFFIMSIVLMLIGFAAFEGNSTTYVCLGLLALGGSAFLMALTIRQYRRDQTIAKWPYYERDEKTGGYLHGAVYGMVAWLVTCVVMFFVDFFIFMAVASAGAMAFPIAGAIMTALWRATATPPAPPPFQPRR